jgi:hypothetical protein
MESIPVGFIREQFSRYIRDDNLVEYLRQCITIAYEQGLRQMDWSKYLGERIDEFFNYIDDVDLESSPEKMCSTKLRCKTTRKPSFPKHRQSPSRPIIPQKIEVIKSVQSEISENDFYFSFGEKV